MSCRNVLVAGRKSLHIFTQMQRLWCSSAVVMWTVTSLGRCSQLAPGHVQVFLPALREDAILDPHR